MMPPRIPPAAAPMMPPFTRSRLVVAPMIAPAAAPMTASRFVLRCGSAGSLGALGYVPYEPLLLPTPPELLVREAVRRAAARRAGAGARYTG